MLEFFLSVIPLILLCTAIGLVIINFDEVISYLIFVVKGLIQPKNEPVKTNSLPVMSEMPQQTKNEVSLITLPFTMLQRMINVVKAIFLPEISLPLSVTKDTFEEVNIVASTAQHEAEKSSIKTYQTATITQPTGTASVTINTVNLHHFEFPLLKILKSIFMYLLIILPFALIGAGIMLYMTETQDSQQSLDQWLTEKIETFIDAFNTQ